MFLASKLAASASSRYSKAQWSRLAPLSRAFESRLAPLSRDSRLWVATREARQLDYLFLFILYSFQPVWLTNLKVYQKLYSLYTDFHYL